MPGKSANPVPKPFHTWQTPQNTEDVYKRQLPASTLRYYEEIGLLTDVIHTESKKRIYTQQHIDLSLIHI